MKEDLEFFKNYQAVEPMDYLKLSDWNEYQLHGSRALRNKDYKTAEEYFRKAYQLCGSARLPHNKFVETMDSLVHLYNDTGRPQLAVPICQNELVLMRSYPGLSPEQFNQTRLQMSSLYCNAGQLDLAIQQDKEVLEHERREGLSVRTMFAYCNLGDIYTQMKDNKKAEPMYKQCWNYSISLKTYDNITISSGCHLADFALARGDRKQAETYYKTCLSFQRSHCTIFPPTWSYLYDHYADLLNKCGRAAEAKSMLKKRDEFLARQTTSRPH